MGNKISISHNKPIRAVKNNHLVDAWYSTVPIPNNRVQINMSTFLYARYFLKEAQNGQAIISAKIRFFIFNSPLHIFFLNCELGKLFFGILYVAVKSCAHFMSLYLGGGGAKSPFSSFTSQNIS